ncbi:hypothetical protein AB838_06890 [Rhodobacteraceae bacterium (ex Bugula neritina AB1)]|nr:hypothetical protein AB838_06890 [Rhodobacteraceae bacterium (ex Bugula neritina AB1)]
MHRNGTLDYARLLAAFGIVFFHVGTTGAAIGYAALPFFLLLLVVLSLPGAARLSFPDYVKGRVQRLLLPWLIWSGVYGGLKLAELWVTGAPFRSEFAPHMLLTGPALHLWFLPFAFATCLALYPLAHLARRTGPESLVLMMLGCGLAVLLLRQEVSLPAPFAQWLYALPAVCVGIALALVWGRMHTMLLILTGFTCAALLSGAHQGLLQIVLAACGLILCLVWHLPASRGAQLAGTLSLGVYLAHPLVLSVLSRTTPLAPDSVTLALLGCLGGLCLALGLHLIPHISIGLSRITPAGKMQDTIS